MSCERCSDAPRGGASIVICPSCRGSGLQRTHLGRDGWVAFRCARCDGARVLERRVAVSFHKVDAVELPPRDEAIEAQRNWGGAERSET